jgi:phosphate transport system substrate-binding protein
MSLSFIKKAALAAGLMTAAMGVASAADQKQITGAGSTFVYPVLSAWAADYAKSNGTQVNYQSIGSGGGIAQIKAATVDFGATDKPLPQADLETLGLAQFPIVIGGIVPVVNVVGIQPGQLKFTGSLLADIFLGKVNKWNDPAITALNPGVSLPDQGIVVVHRSDGSGTTFNFANYLSKVSDDWKTKVGADTAIAWPSGVGGKGNEGVASFVHQVPGAIGYVEYAYALQNKMAYGQVQNAAGNFITPSAESFQAAAASADWTSVKDFNLVMTNAPGKNAYPITATTFALMYKKPKDANQTKTALTFFKWSYENGQKQAAALDYVPLPDALVKQIEAYWKSDMNVDLAKHQNFH